MNRKILAQGDLDGACYLYSIANSYAALTCKQLTGTQWKRSLRASPFKLDDYLCGQGTEALDDTQDYLEGLCRNFLGRIPNTQFEVTRREDVSPRLLRAALTEKQVAIVAINDGDHWVSIVDADKKQFYVACSAVALASKTPYIEERSPNFQRAFNMASSFDDLRIWTRCALFVRDMSPTHNPAVHRTLRDEAAHRR